MIVNGNSLLELCPIVDMVDSKHTHGPTTYGLGEAGYDIRIKQEIIFQPHPMHQHCYVNILKDGEKEQYKFGRFVLASAIEEFNMPTSLVGVVHDKSSWARKGLSVFNTVIEPGWKGYLTLELIYHGNDELIIPAGSGIAQVVFHKTTDEKQYAGRYQNQADEPVSAIHASKV